MLARVGARRWIAVIMVLWGIVSAAMIFVGTPRGFYLLRFLLGAAESGFFPGIILYLKTLVSFSGAGSRSGLFMTAGPLAGVVGWSAFGISYWECMRRIWQDGNGYS